MKHFLLFATILMSLSVLFSCHKENNTQVEDGLFSFLINGTRYSTNNASVQMDTIISKQLKSIVMSASTSSGHIIVFGFSADSCDMSDTCLPLISANSKNWEDFLDASIEILSDNKVWEFEECSFSIQECDPVKRTLSGSFSASFSDGQNNLLLLEDGRFNNITYHL